MKRFFLIVIVLLALGTAGYIYLNNVLLPVQLKQFVINKAKEQLKRELSFSTIQFDLLRGLTVDDLVIYEKDSTTPFVKIKQVQLNLDLAAVLRDKKLTIPSIILREPDIHLIALADNTWNFSDLTAPQEGQKSKSQAPLFLGNININQGHLEITDARTGTESTDVFQDINLKVGLSLTKGIEFDLHIRPAEINSTLQGQGYFQPIDQEFRVDTQIKNVDLNKHALLLNLIPNFKIGEGFIYNADLIVVFKNSVLGVRGNLDTKTKLAGNLGQPFYFDGKVMGNNFVLQRYPDRIDLNGSFNFDITNAQLGDDKGLKGIIYLQDLTLNYTPQNVDIKLVTGDFKNMVVQPVQGKIIAGNFLLQKGYFNFRNDHMIANGQLSTTNSAIQINEDSIIKGNILLQDFALIKESGKLQAAAKVESSPLEIVATKNFKLQGTLKTQRVDLIQQDGVLSIKTNANLTDTLVQLPSQTEFKGNFDLTDLLAIFQDGKWHLKGQAATQGLSGKINEDKTFTGDPQANFDVAIDPSSETPVVYNGQVVLKDASLNGLTQVPQITAITGTMEFSNDQLKTDALSLKALGTQIHLGGHLQNFTAPLLDIKADADTLDLATIKPFFAEKLAELQIDPHGQAKISVLFKGALNAFEKAEITASAEITDGFLDSKKLDNPIENISGKIKYAADSLQWENLKVTYLEEDYTLNGSLSDFQKPSINNKLKSKNWDVSAWLKMDKDTIHIDSFKGTYLGTPFEADGNLYLKEGHLPDADVHVKGNVDLASLTRLAPQLTEQLKKIKPTGTASIQLAFRGSLQDWKKGIIGLDAQSAKTTLYNLVLENVALQYGQGTQDFNGFHLTANAYNGTLKANGELKLLEDNIPLTLAATIDGLDLAVLRKAMKLSDQDLAGTLAAKLNLEGPLIEQRELKGNGSIDITDGNIWQFNLLKGLWKALLIPEFENIIFTEGHTTFTIANKKISTQNLTLQGNVADLTANGWVAFDQNIYFDVSPNFKESSILSSDSNLKKGPSAILAHAQGYMNIKISGTLSKPSYQVNASPGKILEKTTGNILEGVGGIIDDILH